MRRLLLVGVLALGAAEADAAVKCVNKAGSGGCSSTIQGAVTAAAAGDTVSIAAGVYYENVTIPSGKDGLIVVGASKLGTILDGSNNTLAGATGLGGTILGVGSGSVQVKNFTLRNSPASNAIDVSGNDTVLLGLRFLGTGSISLAGGVTGTQVVGNEFRAVTGYVLQSPGSNHGTVVRANRVYAADSGGITVTGDNALVTANLLSQIQDGDAITVAGAAAVVTYNTLSGVEGVGIGISGDGATVAYNKTSLTGLEGVSVAGAGANVHHNSVRHADDDGIYVVAPSGAGSIASFNTVYHAAGYGVFVQAGTSATASSNRVTHTGLAGVVATATGTGATSTASMNVTVDTGSFGVFADGHGSGTANSNRVTNAASAGVFVQGYDPVTSLFGPATSSLNVISGVNGYGIENYGTQSSAVRNTIRDVQGTGIYAYCFGGAACDASPVQYNLITNTGGGSAGNRAFGIDSYTEGDGRILSYNVVTRSTDDSFYISGSAQTVTANRALDQGGDSSLACFFVDGKNNTLTSNQATRCSENGFHVLGTGNTLVGNIAFSNWGNGIEVRASGNTLTSNRSTANTGAGIAIYTGSNALTSNVTGLDRVGLCDQGTTTLTGNTFPDGTTSVCEIDK